MMLAGAVIGRRFENCSFASFSPNGNAPALEACIRLAQGEIEGVLLSGPVGVGKTHLLVALARAVAAEEEGEINGGVYIRRRRGTWVEFWPVLDLVSALREEIGRGVREVSRRCRECDLLVLDDLGAERSTDYVLEELERIIDFRYRDERRIAIGTNLTPEQIAAKYGDRAISRWAQSCEIVRMQGEDYRLRRNK